MRVLYYMCEGNMKLKAQCRVDNIDQSGIRFLYTIKPSLLYFMRNKEEGCESVSKNFTKQLSKIDSESYLKWSSDKGEFEYLSPKTTFDNDVTMNDIKVACDTSLILLPADLMRQKVKTYVFSDADLKKIADQISSSQEKNL